MAIRISFIPTLIRLTIIFVDIVISCSLSDKLLVIRRKEIYRTIKNETISCVSVCVIRAIGQFDAISEFETTVKENLITIKLSSRVSLFVVHFFVV